MQQTHSVTRSREAPLAAVAVGAADADLLSRLHAREGRAFEELVRGTAGRMLVVARRILRDDAEAEDALQEAYLQAFQALPGFAGQARLSTWLHRIVVNACLMRLRRRRRRPEQPIEELLPSFEADGHRVSPGPAWPRDALAELETRELRRSVREAIDRLPERHRTVLVLRDIEGCSNEEVARLLEIREDAVKMRLHRARQALRSLLDPQLAGGGEPCRERSARSPAGS